MYYREKVARNYAPWVYGLCYEVAELPYIILNCFGFLIIVWVLSRYPNPAWGFWEECTAFLGHLLPFTLFTTMCTYCGHAIAALSPNLEVGTAVGPGFASWMSSFSGFYLPRSALPAGVLICNWRQVQLSTGEDGS